MTNLIDATVIPQQPQYQGATDYQLYAVAVAAYLFGLDRAAKDIERRLHPTSINTFPGIEKVIDPDAQVAVEKGEYAASDLATQMRFLIPVANRLGLYDAADYLRRRCGRWAKA